MVRHQTGAPGEAVRVETRRDRSHEQGHEQNGHAQKGMNRMQFGLLGPVQVLDDQGSPVDLGGRQPRLVIAALLVSVGRPVPPDAIFDAVWGDSPPASAAGTLQSYVSRLRSRLGRDVVVFDESGYRLEVPADAVGHLRFERLADEGRAALDAGRAGAAREVLVDAEALWRGAALAEFADRDFATGFAVRLDQRRLAAIEDRFDADLALARHAAVVSELSELIVDQPLRERLQEQHALALYRSGRQVDALRAIATASEALRDLGIEPGRGLRDLEQAILAHDPELDVVARSGEPSDPRSGPIGTSGSTGSTGSRAPAVVEGPGLVGRAGEVAVLDAALAESAIASRFVVIEGEPGIGKTRLADEIRSRAEGAGALAVWGRSDEGGAAPALWPWLRPLRELAAATDDVPAALRELIAGEAPVSAGQAHVVQFERFEAVAELLEAAARKQPVVVLLDDLQWADATSLGLLAFLAGRLGPGVLVVATVRERELGRLDAVTDALAAIARVSGSRRIRLQGLSEGDIAEVLLDSAGRPVDPQLAAAIHSRAEGNPFYALELGRLAGDEGGLGTEIPASVGDVIRRRMALLPDATVELLGVIAVVGREADVAFLSRVIDSDPVAVLDTLDPAVRNRLLVEADDRPGEVRFTHALVREVLLDDMTTLRRARVHLAVADAIEAAGAGIDEAEILAEHLWRAAPVGVGRRAAEALERAADVASRRVSYAAAEQLLIRAVELRRATAATPEDAEAELAAIYKLLEVARALRYFQGAANMDVLDRGKDLAERSGRLDLLRDLLWFEWSSCATSTQMAEATRLANSYMELTTNDPDPLVRGMGMQVRGVHLWMNGRVSEAVAVLDESVRAQALIDAEIGGFAAEQRMLAYAFWIWNSAAHGSLSQAEVFERFDEMVEQAGGDRFAVASVCGFAATVAVAMEAWDDVERYVVISMDADPRSEFGFWGGQALMQQGIVDAWRGDIDDALAHFAEGKARYTGLGARSAVPCFEASLALLLAGHGRPEAEHHIAEARAILDEFGEGWSKSIVLRAEAVVAAASGDAATAADLIDRAIEIATEQGAFTLADQARAVAAELDT